MKFRQFSFLFIIFVFTLSPFSVLDATASSSFMYNSPVQCTNVSKSLFITAIVGDKYNQTTLKAPINTCVKITFHNADDIYHTFSINSMSTNNVTYFNIYLKGGLTNSSNFWTGNANATYKFYCQLPGHDQAGMHGQFIVGAGGPSPFGSPGFTLIPLLLGLFVIYGVIRYIKKKKNI